jgi:hypothetical protein
MKVEEAYIIEIDTNNLFSGDVINNFIVKAQNIEKIMMTIDNVIVYFQKYEKVEEANVIPFKSGIFTFCCERSEILLYVSSSETPVVETMYNLVDMEIKNKYENNKTIGELEYYNGFAKVVCPSVGR